MRIQINAFGTEGDLRPFVALAHRLMAEGHQAAICTPRGFAPIVGSVEHLAMDDGALRLIRDEMPTMRGPRDSLRLLRRMKVSMWQMMLDEWAAARSWSPDVLVYHPKCLAALHVADRLDIPAVLSLPLPMFTPTSAYPVPFLSRSLGGPLNRASYAFNRVTMLSYGSMVNDFRTEQLGLRPRRRTDDLQRCDNGRPVPILYSYSRHISPAPPDYPDHVHVTGSWFADPDPQWQPPAELEAFLADGEPPVYVGFGSMGFQGGQQRTERLVPALLDRGARVLLSTGWGGLAAASRSARVHVIESAPHDWLLPRTSAVVHHGGSGTTAAGLRAGRPTLICPFLGDQPFWGRRVHEIGAGPAPVPGTKIGTDRLGPALDALLGEPSYPRTAAALGERIRAEDGTGAAVSVLTALG